MEVQILSPAQEGTKMDLEKEVQKILKDFQKAKIKNIIEDQLTAKIEDFITEDMDVVISDKMRVIVVEYLESAEFKALVLASIDKLKSDFDEWIGEVFFEEIAERKQRSKQMGR
jgi:hypothetical protein